MTEQQRAPRCGCPHPNPPPPRGGGNVESVWRRASGPRHAGEGTWRAYGGARAAPAVRGRER